MKHWCRKCLGAGCVDCAGTGNRRDQIAQQIWTMTDLYRILLSNGLIRAQDIGPDGRWAH